MRFRSSSRSNLERAKEKGENIFIPTKDVVLDMQLTEFEKYALQILEQQTDGLKNVKIFHDKVVEAHDGNYQLDGYIEFEAMGVLYKTIVECKHYKYPISREIVQKVYDNLRAVGAQKGIIISTSKEPSKTEIEKHIADLHKKYKQKTVKRKIASLKAFYNYLEEEEYIDENPFRRIKVKFKQDVVLPRIISREDIEKLLNYMYAHHDMNAQTEEKCWLRDIAVVEVLFGTGARVYEVSNIRLESVNLYTGSLKIMGKGGKERYVQIVDDSIMKLLHDYYEANKVAIKKSGYFFVNKRGDRYSEQSIRLMLKKYTKMAGIEKNITPHMFRHSFATYLIEEGVDISCVKEILGHSSIKTTQIYLHIALAKQAEILRDKHPRKRMQIIRAA